MTSAYAHTTAATNTKADKQEEMTGARTMAHSRAWLAAGVGDRGNLKNGERVAAPDQGVDRLNRWAAGLEPGYPQASAPARRERPGKNSAATCQSCREPLLAISW